MEGKVFHSTFSITELLYASSSSLKRYGPVCLQIWLGAVADRVSRRATPTFWRHLQRLIHPKIPSAFPRASSTDPTSMFEQFLELIKHAVDPSGTLAKELLVDPLGFTILLLIALVSIPRDQLVLARKTVFALAELVDLTFGMVCEVCKLLVKPDRRSEKGTYA